MTVPPPPINPIVSVQAITTTGVDQNSSQLPPALANARSGTIIEGFVVNRDANQNPILRTAEGDLLVRSEVFLRTGSNVQIRVDAQLESRARIILIDGLSPENYAKSQPQRARGDVILPSSIAPGNAAQTGARAQASQAITLPALLLSDQSAPSGGINKAAATTGSIAANASVTSAATTNNVQITILSITPPASAANKGLLSAADFLQNTAPPPSGNQANTAAATIQTTTATPNTATSAAPAQPTQPAIPSQPAPINNATANAANAATTSPTSATLPSQPAATAAPTNQTVTTAPQPASTTLSTQSLTSQNTPAAASQPNVAATVNITSQNQTAPPTQPNTIAATASATASASNSPTPSAAPSAAPANALPQANNPALAPQTSATTAPAPANTNVTPPPTPAASEAARVIGQDSDGASIIQAGSKSYKLFTARPLPVGAELRVSITQSALPTEPQTALPAKLTEFSSLARHWPALDQAASLIAATQNSAQPISVNQLAPNVGPSLTTDMLFFLAAVRGGDLTHFWPKQVVQFLQKKQPELLQRLQTDSTQMQQLAQPQPYPNWSVFLLPLFFGEHADQARLYMREDAHEGEQQDKQGGQSQRFIMELELSHLGEMQLDGLVRSKNNDKPTQFDLVIRTVKPLAEETESTIQSLYQNALEQTKMTGKIRFQEGRHHFVYPASELSHTPKNDENGGDFDFTIMA